MTRPMGGGALVISLDFELHWGVRDLFRPDGPYHRNLVGAREVIPRMLDRFEAGGVRVTWATVGMLFARDRDEQAAYRPRIAPGYTDPNLDPYAEPVGRDETDDPLHFGSSLIERIAERGEHEIASHTWSHYYCMEPGATPAAFADDLASAVRLAEAQGHRLRSFAFPRNQIREDVLPVLAAAGFTSFRGTQPRLAHQPVPEHRVTFVRKVARGLEEYAGPRPLHVTRFDDLRTRAGVLDIPATLFLRPWSARRARLEPFRWRRVAAAFARASREDAIVHVWWHPHNFGANQDANLALLDRLIELFREARDARGMRSMTMAEVTALRTGQPAGERERRAAGTPEPPQLALGETN